MRFHFDFARYAAMLRFAFREPNAAARARALSVLLLAVPAVASFHAVCFFLDGLLYPALRRTPIRAPVFILGHARSGTTLIHRLISQDGERFSAFRLYELYFPSLLQKKLIRALMRLDRRALGGAIGARVRAWEARHYAAVRRVHAMGLTEYEEDDILFYYACASGFWVSKMPFPAELDFYGVDDWPPRERRRLMRFYADCVRRQLLLNGTHKIHLSKNPIFAGRVEALIEAFPDARFIVPVRNPYETIPSLLKLVRGGWKHRGFDPARQAECLRILAEQSFHTYRHPLEVLARHPETRSAIVDYRELVADPAATLESVHAALELPLDPAFLERLRETGRREQTHRSGHAYSLAEFGLDADAIRSGLADLFERFGWDAAPAARAEEAR